jgi:hypothetical protein
MADQQWYPQGARPRVLINWQSFVDQGITASWQGAFTDAVINAYTRWMNVGGVDLRFQFWGYTDRTESGDGELVISMNERHFDSTRLASTFGSYNRLIIVFHRKNGSDLSPWNFVPYNANTGEFDMQGILIHELGHCLGLDHSSGANDTMNGGYEYHRQRYGPFADDVRRLRIVYPLFTRNNLRELATSDGGASWPALGNNLTSYNHSDARTNINAGVSATPSSGLYVIGWTMPGTTPTWLRGDGNTFMFNPWFFYGGERSIYGPAYAADDGHTMLWAWVTNDDNGSLRIVRSRNDALSWEWASTPAGAQTFGTPALCWTRVNGQSTWVLAWSHFDRNNHGATGHIRASISTDEGWSWSAPVEIQPFYKALSGVSLSASTDNRILLAFAWAPHSVYGMNLIRAINCRVSAGQLQSQSIVYSSWATRIQPSVAFDRARDRWLLAWREQDFNTSINASTKGHTDGSWGALIRPGVRSHVAPALAYSPPQNRTVLWYAFET